MLVNGYNEPYAKIAMVLRDDGDEDRDRDGDEDKEETKLSPFNKLADFGFEVAANSATNDKHNK